MTTPSMVDPTDMTGTHRRLSAAGISPAIVDNSLETTHHTQTQKSHADSASVDSTHKAGAGTDDKEAQILAAELAHDDASVEGARARRHEVYQKLRPFILAGLALVILGWWISATVLEATRHRWYVLLCVAHFYWLLCTWNLRTRRLTLSV